MSDIAENKRLGGFLLLILIFFKVIGIRVWKLKRVIIRKKSYYM